MSHTWPPIKGFLPSTMIDWGGKLAAEVFLPGCDFRCPFCHASALVLRAQELPTVAFETVADHLRHNAGWFDGVIISGGEPTLHPGLRELILALRELAPAVKLDTNGARPEVVGRLIGEGLIEAVAMDVKAPLDHRYARACGVEADLEAVGATIDLLRASSVEHQFRTTVVPGIHEPQDIVAIARRLGEGESLVLQQFAPLECLDPSFLDVQPYPRDAMRQMAVAAREFVADCHVRGDLTSVADALASPSETHR